MTILFSVTRAQLWTEAFSALAYSAPLHRSSLVRHAPYCHSSSDPFFVVMETPFPSKPVVHRVVRLIFVRLPAVGGPSPE